MDRPCKTIAYSERFPLAVVANTRVEYSAFKDVALQFLGNLFEYFLVRKNKGKSRNDRSRLTVIGATSGDVDHTDSVEVSLLICLDWICSDLRSTGQERRLSIHHVPDGKGQCYTGDTGQYILGFVYGLS